MTAQRILLVNGDFDTRQAYRILLELKGFTVLEAATAADALALVRQDPPDLVIQELRLGGAADGVELIRAVKRAGTARPLAVLVITSQALEGERAASAGCDAFLLKPCRPSQMLEAARRLLAVA